jgi:arabinogalactan oligomer/maltooligosaccharide transport system substrate-binding protein
VHTPVPPQPTPQPVTLTVWHGWQAEFLANVEQIFRDYETAHPDVRIELVRVPDLGNRIISAIPGGEKVDILAFGMEWVGRLADAGLILPVSDYGVSRDFIRDNYIGPAAEAMTYKGKVWGFPEAVECVTWIYNKALVGEAELPKSTDELLAKAKDWNAANPGKFFFVYPAQNDPYFSGAWWYGAGAYFVKEDGSVGLESEAGLRAARFIAQLPPIMPQPVDYVAATALFKEGKAAIIQNGPWFLPELEAVGIDYGLALIPEFSGAGRPAMPFVSGKALLVAANCQRPDLAVDVLKYFTSAESQTALSIANGTIPTLLDWETGKAVIAIDHFARQAALGAPLPSTPYMSGLWDPVTALLEALWAGADPEQALQAAQEQALKNVAELKK